MTRYVYLYIAAVLLISCQSGSKNFSEQKWIPLFNGKDLTGWEVKFSGYPVGENHNNTFRVENGLLRVVYDEYDHFDGSFGHLFYNKRFSSYKIRVVYRFIGDQVEQGPSWGIMNNGIMIHAQSAGSMLLNQDFPVSVEVQLLGSNDTLLRPNGNVCTPGTNVTIHGEVITQHCTQSSSSPSPANEWTTVEVVVHSDSIIHHIVNGDTVLTYSHPVVGGGMIPEGFPLPEGTPLKEGYIAIQAESAPTEFRTIELLPLDK